MIGKLYFVGTPIGNLADITFRAVEILRFVDEIGCEDTRHSQILLNHYEIKKPTFSYHKFNEKESTIKILNMLNEGKNIAIISDAGMPIISDPGAVLLQSLIQQEIEYEIIPGVSAVVTALVGSGINSRSFCFGGFLPEKEKERLQYISNLARAESTLIFYSASHDINKDLKSLSMVLGNRDVVVANDMTKKFEKYYRGKLNDLTIDNPKGEFVILIAGEQLNNTLNELSIEEHLAYYMKNEKISRMEGLKLVAKDRNMSKSEVYKLTQK